MIWESLPEVGRWFVSVAQSSIVPAFRAFLIAVPIFAVLAAIWGYFSLERGSQSIRTAFKHVLPIEDYKTVSSRSDFWVFALNKTLFLPALGSVAKILAIVLSSEVLARAMTNWMGTPDFKMTSVALIVALQAGVTILSNDLAFYVWHRLSHQVEILWSFHRGHHSAESLTVFTSPREHPVHLVGLFAFNTAFATLLVGPVLYLTGAKLHPMAATALGAFGGFGTVLTLFHHSRVRVSLGKASYFFNTPVLHQIHHSAELEHRDKNFGSYLSVFDVLFGTLYVPQMHESWRVGLNDEEMGKTNPHRRVVDFYFEPFRHAWGAVRRLKASARQKGTP